MEEEIREPCRALSQGETLAFEEEHSGGREAKEGVGTGWCGGRYGGADEREVVLGQEGAGGEGRAAGLPVMYSWGKSQGLVEKDINF